MKHKFRVVFLCITIGIGIPCIIILFITNNQSHRSKKPTNLQNTIPVYSEQNTSIHMNDTNPMPPSQQQKSNQNNLAKPKPFDKSQHSLTDPASIWVIVNKKNPLPLNYKPELVVPSVRLRLSASQQQMQISKTAASAIKEMFDAAQKEGINLVFGSGYRSASLQEQLYNTYKAKDGQLLADTYSARPGYSEHQTGLAVDISSKNGNCYLEICWENTLEGKWVATNGHKYGFILRYQRSKESITGYQYEPWHFRYVGKDLANEIYQSGLTLEEFFGYPPAPHYD